MVCELLRMFYLQHKVNTQVSDLDFCENGKKVAILSARVCFCI